MELTIDPSLAEGPVLAPAATPAVHFLALRDHLEDTFAPGARLVCDHDRDQMLLECRERFDLQLAHDLDYNLQQLWHLALSLNADSPVLEDACVQALFADLDQARAALETGSGWFHSADELRCYRNTQQFYCDALALADRLLRWGRGDRMRIKPAHQWRKRALGESAGAYDAVQSLGNAIDQALPHILDCPQLLRMWPLVGYTLRTAALPWPRYSWRKFLNQAARLVQPKNSAAPRNAMLPVVDVRGRDAFLNNPELFDPASGRTRNNVIVVFGHRHSTLDLAVFGHAMKGIENGIWANEQYFPISARRDRRVVLVRPGGKRQLDPVLRASRRILVDDACCLTISPDGCAPYLPYGQQMRVKRGIRLLIDHLADPQYSGGRRTFIVPLTLDDTAFFVKGRDLHIKATFHDPICTEDIDTPSQTPDPQDVNGGDPLLNHLEALFIANSGLTRHGWRTPRVVDTVRQRLDEPDPRRSPRAAGRRRLHASLTDLAQDWFDAESDQAILHVAAPTANGAARRARTLRVDDKLEPRETPASAFKPLVDRVAELGQHNIIIDDMRDRLLGDYRCRFRDQLLHDLDYNRQGLERWWDRLGHPEEPMVLDALGQLQALRDVLANTDGWATSRNELQCWNAFHQFYCDALCLGHHLLALELGRPTWRTSSLRRTALPGAGSYRSRQAWANYLEQAIPDLFKVRRLQSFAPVLWYQLLRSVLPRPIWRSMGYLRKMHVITSNGTLSSYGAGLRPRIVVEGADELLDDSDFFEPRTGRTRHNLIIAFSHRHSFLDLSLPVEAFGRIDFASWSNIQYFPKSAALDPLTVSVTPGQSRRMDATLGRSLELLEGQRVPLAIYVDGGSPYLPYGQQMRIKPGLRALVDHLRGHAADGRRNYILPVSFNDTVTFARGLDPTLRVQFHPPIDLATVENAPKPARRDRPNRGDPLINHLECLFLSCTGQVRHGWQTPGVEDTVRRVFEENRQASGLRPRLKRAFHPTIMDLCRARPDRDTRSTFTLPVG